jgi:hypothetical protein
MHPAAGKFLKMPTPASQLSKLARRNAFHFEFQIMARRMPEICRAATARGEPGLTYATRGAND